MNGQFEEMDMSELGQVKQENKTLGRWRSIIVNFYTTDGTG